MNKAASTDTTSKTESTKKKEYKFDLSDGLGFEDIAAIFSWIFKVIVFILKVIFYPYYWIFQEIGRTIHFLMNPHDGPLTDDEKVYVQSVPFFFLMFGFFVGILIGAIVIFIKIDEMRAFIEKFNADVAVDIIVSFFQFLIDALKFIIIGLWDVTTFVLGTIFEIAAKDVLLILLQAD